MRFVSPFYPTFPPLYYYPKFSCSNVLGNIFDIVGSVPIDEAEQPQAEEVGNLWNFSY